MTLKKLSTFKDDLIMPFGKYKGIPMEKVPVNYLHWFWHNVKVGNEDVNNVRSYIHYNLTVLMDENKDLIWD